MALKYDV